MFMRRALCVGIEEYDLNGCVNDAQRMKAILERQHDGSPNFECKALHVPKGQPNVVTRAVLREFLTRLLGDPADVALFHFSGHGMINNLDGYLVTQDAKKSDEGVAMSEILKLANDSAAREVVLLLDCCFSGALGNVPSLDSSKTILREGISILTAGRGDQPSVEAGGGGVFTSLVVDALDGGAANILGAVSAPAIYAYVEAALGAWDQRPMFKSHVSSAVELRCCTPPIERAILRRIN
jgi:caspase domain-containing protein